MSFLCAGPVAKHNKTSPTTNSERCSKMNEIKTIHQFLKHSLCRLIKTCEKKSVTYILSIPIIELGFKESYKESTKVQGKDVKNGLYPEI